MHNKQRERERERGRSPRAPTRGARVETKAVRISAEALVRLNEFAWRTGRHQYAVATEALMEWLTQRENGNANSKNG